MIQLKNFILDRNKKKYWEIFNEVMTLWKQDGEFPIHYFKQLVFRKDSPHYSYFIRQSTICRLWNSQKLHTEEAVEILENKVKFNDFCIQNNLQTPIMLAYNNESDFFTDDKKTKVENQNSFMELLKEIIEINQVESIFLKPIDGIQGKGCYRICTNDLKNNERIDELFAVILPSKYIIQKTVEQHPTISKINRYCINTIRIDTYIKDDGNVEILSGLMRFGRKGSVVDNASSSGGFFIPLDLEEATLKGHGIQLLKIGYKNFYEHPDTKIKLDGYKIPYMEETKDLVKNAANALGDRLVGWDVAITPEGPILIEGNHNYHIGMQEMAYGGYKRHPIFKEILEKYT